MKVVAERQVNNNRNYAINEIAQQANEQGATQGTTQGTRWLKSDAEKMDPQ